MASAPQKVDHSALKVNQGSIIVLLVAGFVANLPWLVAGTALIMLAGTAIGRPGFFFIYAGLLRPMGVVRPDLLSDNPEPHRFAQGFGGVVAALSATALFLGSGVLGWILGWIVAALAALNLFTGFCAGCAVYYWMNRLGIPGFSKRAPEGTLPGMRPRLG